MNAFVNKLLLILALISVSSLVQGATITSTFGPADSYQSCCGTGTVFPTQIAYAFRVPAASNYLFTGAALALSQGIGNVNAVDITLAADAAGQPGATIESFHLVNALGPAGANNPLVVATSTIQPVLKAGGIYWLILAPSTSGNGVNWQTAAIAPTPPLRAIRSDNASPWTVLDVSLPANWNGAFKIFANPLSSGGKRTYTVSPVIGPFGFVPAVSGLNDLGLAAGYLDATNSYIGTTVIAPPSGWQSITLRDVNNAGQAVGYVSNGGTSVQAAFATTSGITIIPIAPGFIQLFGINNAGEAVGWGSGGQSFVGASGGINLIPGAFQSVAINDLGQVTGTNGSQAIIGTTAGVTVIPGPPGMTQYISSSINNSGQVAGAGYPAGSNNPQAFIGTVAGSFAIPLPQGATAAGAQAINNAGVVVGGSDSGPWVWDETNATRFLQDLVPPGWTVTGNLSVLLNNAGQIVTDGIFGNFHGPVILTPPATKVGIFRPSLFMAVAQDVNGNIAWDQSIDKATFFGAAGDTMIYGDWDGSGSTKVGIYRANPGMFALDLNGNGAYDPGIDTFGFYGQPGDVPVVGDWDGDGRTKVGIYRPSTGLFALDYNGNLAFDSADKFGKYGLVGDSPVVGDWTGDGKSKIGTFRNGLWSLDANNNLKLDAGDGSGTIGQAGDTPLVGDWNGDGKTEVGFYRSAEGSFSEDYNGNLTWDDGVDRTGVFGSPGSTPVVGDWTGSGVDRIGVFFGNGYWGLDVHGHLAWDSWVRFGGFGDATLDTPAIGKWQ